MGKAKKFVLKNLPPTERALVENVKRAHYCVAPWKSAKNDHPIDVNLEEYGWLEEENRLVPNMGEIKVPPSAVLKLLSCTCKSENPCGHRRCGCNNAKIPCTVFCSCSCQENCCNPAKSGCFYDEDSDDEN